MANNLSDPELGFKVGKVGYLMGPADVEVDIATHGIFDPYYIRYQYYFENRSVHIIEVAYTPTKHIFWSYFLKWEDFRGFPDLDRNTDSRKLWEKYRPIWSRLLPGAPMEVTAEVAIGAREMGIVHHTTIIHGENDMMTVGLINTPQ